MIAVHIVGNPGGGSSPEPVHGRLYVSIKETVTQDKSNQFMDAFM